MPQDGGDVGSESDYRRAKRDSTRRPAKRARRQSSSGNSASSSEGEEQGDLFGARQLADRAAQDGIDATLVPVAYEVRLNRDAELFHHFNFSSHLDQDEQPDTRRTRLVPWSGLDGQGNPARIWTDRLDAVHLLTQLPRKPVHMGVPRPAPTATTAADDSDSSDGWSDLGSDAEDTFFMSDDEAADFVRDKKRRKLEADRQRRIAALTAAEQQQGPGPEPEAKPSSFPDEQQYQLMQRTAKALTQSDNRPLLEMKILANHGSDPRFAFLRSGKAQLWSDVWQALKDPQSHLFSYQQMRSHLENPKQSAPPAPSKPSSSLLVNYDTSSDTD